MGLSTAAASEVNVANLSRIQRGMTEWEVRKIMRKPYEETVIVWDKATYDIWFYVTNPVVMGQSKMEPLNLTPLTFKNGILIGTGYLYYNFLKKQLMEAETIRQEPKELEDTDLEKTLCFSHRDRDDEYGRRRHHGEDNKRERRDEDEERRYEQEDRRRTEYREGYRMNEDDDEMLDLERQQDFDQT